MYTQVCNAEEIYYTYIICLQKRESEDKLSLSSVYFYVAWRIVLFFIKARRKTLMVLWHYG